MIAGSLYFVQAVQDLFAVIDMRGRDIREPDDRVHGRAYVVGHIGQEGALGVCRVPGLLESILKKPSLSKVLLALLLDIRESEQHLYGV